MGIFYVLACPECASKKQKIYKRHMTYRLYSSILLQKHGTLLAYVI